MSTEPTTSSDPMTNAEATAEAIAVSDPGATPAAEAPATEATAAATTEGTTAPAAPAAEQAAAPSRRARALVLTRRVVRMAFALTLLGVGLYAGWQTYLGSRPVVQVVGDPAVAGVPTPAIVAELVNAIAADDADAIRSALSQEIFSNYTSDMERFGIATVDDVQTLGTYADGPRTATALVIFGRDADRNPFNINLVVLTQDGLIVRLR